MISQFTGLAFCGIAIVSSLAAFAGESGDPRIANAVKNKDRETVRILISQHADVNAPLGDGATALAWAAHWNDLETADLLIRAGARANAANDYGVTPLSLACENGNAVLVEKLLEARANPNISRWSGETPLMTCARTGNNDAVKALLRHGADVNQQTRRGQTALMWAVAQKRPEVVRSLIEHRANVNAKSHLPEGSQPEQFIFYGLRDSEDTHLDPASSRGGFTPLMFAAQAGDIEIAKMLLQAGANVNDIAPDYGSAVVVASANGHEALAMFLVGSGAEPNTRDGWGFTALHYALWEGIATLSAQRGPLPTDRYWLHPNMPKLLKTLLAHGADPNARVGKGFPPYSYAPFMRADINAIPSLRQPGATALLLAAACSDVDSMRALIEKGADPQLGTDDGVTPLMVAAGLGRFEDRTFQQDWTQEEESRALQAVKLLVERGADLNAPNNNGQTALHSAAYRGANTVIQFLADKGASLDAKDKYGATPLRIAAGRRPPMAAPRDRTYRVSPGHEATADLLLRLGATPLPPSQ